MAPARRNLAGESESRTALLDAVEQLMLDEGYAAVTTRRVANRAGVNAALVFYYFGTMDELFLAVLRRRAEWMLARQAEALASDQPLWALWDATRDLVNGALYLEFLALGNHRAVVKAEVVKHSDTFRRQQLDALSSVLDGYALDPALWPTEAVVVLLTGIARFLLIEKTYALELGHGPTIAVIERCIAQLEGERRPRGDQQDSLARHSA